MIDDDFPDPDVLEVEGTYYAYGTNGNNRNVRVARSTDLVEWEVLPDAMPELPSWVIPGKTWAPEVEAWFQGKLQPLSGSIRGVVAIFPAILSSGGSELITASNAL